MAPSTQQRVLIGKGLEPHADGAEGHRVVHLPCPRTGQPHSYVLTSGGQLLELNMYKHKCSSWLVGQRLLPDGGMYLATPLDPLLVALPLIDGGGEAREAAGGASASGAGMFCEADTLLGDAAPPLAPLVSAQLGCICDVKGVGGGEAYYRYNADKAAAWLRCKVRQTLAAFREAGPASIGGMDEAGQLSYVLGFLSEYLPPRWSAALAEHYQTQASGIGGAVGGGGGGVLRPANRPAGDEGGGSQASAEKKAKVLDPKDVARKKAEASRVATQKAKLAKAGEGSLKISSFFGGGKS